ncbi:MAG TPA: peroxide stress protein YaaA [Mycobacteriales bacterium]|nr:peroxide stress protein YaaA [Mycobacteriales bacterium]
MLVLLPPSEAKTPGGDGPPVDLAALSWPELTATRRKVGNALVRLCTGNPKRARTILGLSEALDDDRESGAHIWESPTLPAGHRYAGVLHDALGYPTLPAAARRRADATVVVLSGLWGATRPTDLIPAYRIGIGTKLPRLAGLPATWHTALGHALDDEVRRDGALDLRSSGYSLMYRPSRGAAARLVTVRITGPDGKRAAPSFQSKVAKGAVVAAMLRRGVPSVDNLLAVAAGVGLGAEQVDDSSFVVRVMWEGTTPPIVTV